MLWRRCTLLGALLAVLPPIHAFLDPFTLTGIGVTAALSLYASWDKLGCKLHMKECCDEKNIIADFRKLENSMMKHVFGQHLVVDLVVKALRGHFYQGHSSKALAMSFHGWPGGGKNYVSQFITNSLYAKGSRSQFVHFFAGKLHFPLQEQADIYRLHLQDWIRGNVSQCPWSTFIFDEVDKMPRGVLDAVKPFIDHHDHIDGVEYRHAIFIFLSNTGGNTITKRYLQLWQSGKRREDFELRDFEDLIRKGAFNEAGGFHKNEAIESNLIDHYVPFLPLEEKHVRLCVVEEFKKRGVMDPQEELVDEIMKDVTFGPDVQRIFSNSGCKRLSHKVLTLIERLKYRDMTEDTQFYTRR